MTGFKLSGLWIYPIKSAGGISLDQAEVSDRGLAFDRRWMVVDATGRFLTQRQIPQMALIQVALIDGGLRLSAAGMPDLDVEIPDNRSPIEVEVWGDRCWAWSAGAVSQAWLSQILLTPCQLVFMPDESDRPIKTAPTRQVSFADAYPFLLISEASLEDLNDRLEHPVPMNRFRPNLVVSGCDAFAEDTWTEIAIGSVRFQVVKPCARCIVTTVDQTTGDRGKEPLQTLATYRAWDGKIWFGQNLIQATAGTLQIGNEVTVLA